jgi:tRNA pseudouridine32 synthase / 23S rRNA pseudouridine746 synthase
VPLYKNRAPIRVVAAVPEHMRQRLAECGWQGDLPEQSEPRTAPTAPSR